VAYKRAARIIAVAAIACSLHCSLFANFDNFVSNRREGISGDSATLADGGAPVNFDSGTRDSEPVDAARSIEGGSFCSTVQPAPAFCEDFDQGPPSSWVLVSQATTGSIASDTFEAKSPPSSRRLLLPGTASGAACQYHAEQRSLSVDYTESVRVEHDIFIGHLNDNGGVPAASAINTMTFSAPDGSGACDVFFNFGAGATAVALDPQEAREAAIQYPLSVVVVPRAWTHVAIEVKNSINAGADPTLRAWVNGALALDSVPITSNRKCKTGRFRGVSVGAYCYGGPTDIEVRTDNLVAWTK
jgi:hypothetical protein